MDICEAVFYVFFFTLVRLILSDGIGPRLSDSAAKGQFGCLNVCRTSSTV